MTEPVCLITGAGDGTGAAMARRFAQDGYRVALLARTEERLKRLEKEIPGSRGYVCDISDLDALRRSVDQARKDLGPIRVAIHNAAQGAFGPVLEADPQVFEQLFRENILYRCTTIVLSKISTDDSMQYELFF